MGAPIIRNSGRKFRDKGIATKRHKNHKKHFLCFCAFFGYFLLPIQLIMLGMQRLVFFVLLVVSNRFRFRASLSQMRFSRRL